MRKNRAIYWVTTGIIAGMMLFSAYSYLTKPEMTQAFRHLGFPDYFRVELAVAKILGSLVILLPQIPDRIKEWGYAGFGIVFVSAFLAHLNNGDSGALVAAPLIFLLILIVSNIYLYKQEEARI